MDKELKDIYKWLRAPILYTSEIPKRIMWYTLCLLKDFDVRLKELENDKHSSED